MDLSWSESTVVPLAVDALGHLLGRTQFSLAVGAGAADVRLVPTDAKAWAVAVGTSLRGQRRDEQLLWLGLGTVNQQGDERPRAIWLMPITVQWQEGWHIKVTGAVCVTELGARLLGHQADAPPTEALLAKAIKAGAKRGLEILPTVAVWCGTANEKPTDATLPAAKWSTETAMRWAPLDANGGQQLAIRHALAGDNFCVRGAPGSGVTQTIANMAAMLAAEGRRVLIVSPYVEQLERARDFLSAIGIGDASLLVTRSTPTSTLQHALLRREKSYRPTALLRAPMDILASCEYTLDRTHKLLHERHHAGLTIHEALDELIRLKSAPKLGRGVAPTWQLSATELADTCAALADVEAAGAHVTPVASHPWRWSALREWHVTSRERAEEALVQFSSALGDARRELTLLGEAIPGLPMFAPEQFAAAIQYLELMRASARPGAELMGAALASNPARGRQTGAVPTAADIPRDATSYVALLRRRADLLADLATRWDRVPTGSEAVALAKTFERWSNKGVVTRKLMLAAERRALRRHCLSNRLPSDTMIARDLQLALDAHYLTKLLSEAHHAAVRWFGDLSGGDPMEVAIETIEAALAWTRDLDRAVERLELAPPVRDTVWRSTVAHVVASSPATRDQPDDFVERATAAQRAMERFATSAAEFALVTGVDVMDLWRRGDASWPGAGALINSWQQALAELPRWVAFNQALDRLREVGLPVVAAAVGRGDVAPEQLASAWRRSFLLGWLEHQLADAPDLAQFDGETSRDLGHRFAEAAKHAQLAERSRIAVEIAKRIEAVSPNEEPFDPTLSSAWARARLPIVLATPRAARLLSGFDTVVIDGADMMATLPASAPHVILAGSAGDSGLFTATKQWQTVELSWVHRAVGPTAALAEAYKEQPSLAWTPNVAGGKRAVWFDSITANLLPWLASEASRLSAVCVLDDGVVTDAWQALVNEAPGQGALIQRWLSGATVIDSPAFVHGVVRAESLVALAQPIDAHILRTAFTRATKECVLVSPSAESPDSQVVSNATVTGIEAALAAFLSERNIPFIAPWGDGGGGVRVAVCSATNPVRPILAIELDTAAGCFASVIDREVTRPKALLDQGIAWYRIATIDWFADPLREIARLNTAIMAASAAERSHSRPHVQTPPTKRATAKVRPAKPKPATPTLAEGSGPVVNSMPGVLVTPYAFATVPSGRRRPTDLFSLRYVPELVKLVERVVHVEAPLCVEMLARRIAPYFGMNAVNARAVDYLRSLVAERFHMEDDVVWKAATDVASFATVRVPSSSEVRRSLDEVPLHELAAAIDAAAVRVPGAADDDLIKEAARILGWGRVSEKGLARGKLALGIRRR